MSLSKATATLPSPPARQISFFPSTSGKSERWGHAFVIKNGERSFIFSEKGDLIIAKLTPEKYEELSRAHLLDPVNRDPGRPVVWSHPAFANKCVYARNDKEIVCVSLAVEKVAEALKAGDTIELNGRKAALRRLETLPYVESEYTKRFKFDAFENPNLRKLRERYRLDEVIAPGKDEFERQVLLLDWTHRQFKKFGKPSTNCHGALAILGAIGEGHTFFCAQYAEVLMPP